MIHWPGGQGLKIARCQRWIVCYFENRAIVPSGGPLCWPAIVNLGKKADAKRLAIKLSYVVAMIQLTM